MAQISVTWNAEDGKPYADDLTVHGQSATVITWVPDGTVTITDITTPTDTENNDDFTQPTQVGGSSNWQCTDNCDNDGDYNYTITGTPISGGEPASHDPKITNDRG